MSIVRSDDLRDLSRQLSKARDVGEPYTLFLGSGCARAAGVPDLSEIAMQFFTEELANEKSWAGDYMSSSILEEIRHDPIGGRDILINSFYRMISKLSPPVRYSILQQYYGKIPVPEFYLQLARMIKDGYFAHIVTTSIDNLLENALAKVGIGRNEYDLISLASEESRLQSFPESNDKKFLIVKLHGDLEEQTVVITPQEIEETLHLHRRFVQGEMAGSMLMVGYNSESGPIETWLTWTSGPLWWVNPEIPGYERRERIEQTRMVVYITGSAARPYAFFDSLSSLLNILELDWVDPDQDPYSYLLKESELPDDPTPMAGTLESAKPAAPVGKEEQLQDQIQQSYAVLSDLEIENLATGEDNEKVQENLERKKEEIVELENQLRELTYSQHVVVELLKQVSEAAAQNSTDAGSVVFFETQNELLDDEYQRSQPSQDVIAATISAVTIMARLLGHNVIDEHLLDKLASTVNIAASEVLRR